MPESLMVLGKVSMACPGSKESAKGGSGEGQFMGVFIQVNGEVLVLLWSILSPKGLKSAPVFLLQSPAGPGISCRRGVGLWGRPGTSFCLFIRLLVPCDTSMPRDPVDMDLPGWDSLTSGGPVGPGVHGFLYGLDGLLARASRMALQLSCHFLVIKEEV